MLIAEANTINEADHQFHVLQLNLKISTWLTAEYEYDYPFNMNHTSNRRQPNLKRS